MIALLTLLLAAATPEETLSGSFEAYTRCLRDNAGAGPVDRERAEELTRRAIALCADERETMLAVALEVLAPRFGAEEARRRATDAAKQIDAVFPATLMGGPLRIVPESRCASEIEVRDGCY